MQRRLKTKRQKMAKDGKKTKQRQRRQQQNKTIKSQHVSTTIAPNARLQSQSSPKLQPNQ
jgi:Skp family chaperone for outer membrane proteins